MTFPGNLYDILKWVSLVALDAFGVAYQSLSGVWGLPYGDEVFKTCVIISVLIGTLIGVSGIAYQKRISQDSEEPS